MPVLPTRVSREPMLCSQPFTNRLLERGRSAEGHAQCADLARVDAQDSRPLTRAVIDSGWTKSPITHSIKLPRLSKPARSKGSRYPTGQRCPASARCRTMLRPKNPVAPVTAIGTFAPLRLDFGAATVWTVHDSDKAARRRHGHRQRIRPKSSPPWQRVRAGGTSIFERRRGRVGRACANQKEDKS
jgi:hypothetical protein